MTKVDAIRAVMQEYNGIATLQMIYNETEKYYPNIKASKEWQAGLRGVLYRAVKQNIFKKIDDATYALDEYDLANMLPTSEQNITTEKEIITKTRTLQYKYRKNLLKTLRYCPITLISDERLLFASHIKPWCFSNDKEKLDIYNGFILSPLYDRLFDRGFITFSINKELLISPTLSKETIRLLNIKEGRYEHLPVEGRESYLEFHHKNIFVH